MATKIKDNYNNYYNYLSLKFHDKIFIVNFHHIQRLLFILLFILNFININALMNETISFNKIDDHGQHVQMSKNSSIQSNSLQQQQQQYKQQQQQRNNNNIHQSLMINEFEESNPLKLFDHNKINDNNNNDTFNVMKRKKRFPFLSSSLTSSFDSSPSSSSTSSLIMNKSLINGNSSSSSTSIRESIYVCEDDQLELSCRQNDKHIDVLRANFGRFSIQLCNPSGFLDWSVNCASGNSILPILIERCANQNKCSIKASSKIFGDPCPGTAKYLEVHYRCISELERIESYRNSNNNIDRSISANSTIVTNNNVDNNNNNNGLKLPSDLYFMRKISDNDNLNHSSMMMMMMLSSSTTTKATPTILQENLNRDHFAMRKQKNQRIMTNFKDNSEENQQQPHSLFPFVPKTYNNNYDDNIHHKNSDETMSFTTTINKFDDIHDIKNAFNDNVNNKSITNNSQRSNESPTSSLLMTCNSIIYRDIQWPPTLAGSIAVRPCPHDSTGLAKWKCGNIINDSHNNNNNRIKENDHFSNSKLSTSMSQIQKNLQPPPPSPPSLLLSSSIDSPTSNIVAKTFNSTTIKTITGNSQQQNIDHLINNNDSNRASSSWIHLPDLSQCHSRWLLQLNSIHKNNQNNYNNYHIWNIILTNLRRPESIKHLYGGDINQLILLLENWLFNYIDNKSNRFTIKTDNDNFMNQILDSNAIFDIISEILSIEHQQSWLDLPLQKRELNAVNLINLISKFSLLNCLNDRMIEHTAAATATTTTMNSKEIIKQSPNLIMSCFSISNLIHEFQMNWNKFIEQREQQQLNYSEFKYELLLLLPSTMPTTTILSSMNYDNKVKIFFILNNSDEHRNAIINENIYYSIIIPMNLENYFQLSNMNIFTDFININSDYMIKSESFLNLIQIDSTESFLFDDNSNNDMMDTFINGQIVKFTKFNDEKIILNDDNQHNNDDDDNIYGHRTRPLSSIFNNHYMFEIIFKHLVDYNDNNVNDNNNDDDDNARSNGFNVMHHQCVHWNESLNQWSDEHCILVESNITHSVCRCKMAGLSICTILAFGTKNHHQNNQQQRRQQQSTYNLTILDSGFNDQTISKKFINSSYNESISLIIIIYIWVSLFLLRYNQNFFNQSNFTILLLLCIVRTMIEFFSMNNYILKIMIDNDNNSNWLIMETKWCHTRIFLLIYQLQIVCSLFTIFLFHNIVLLLLANKIYLTKNYQILFQTLRMVKYVQLLFTLFSPLLYLFILYTFYHDFQINCWPLFNSIVTLFFVTSPILQIIMILFIGIIYLHCSKRIFSEYDYPATNNINTMPFSFVLAKNDTSLMEKYIKKLFFNRCKYILIWIFAILIYLICIVGCLCYTLYNRHTSYSMIGIDISISLTFVLFINVKYLYNLIVKCGDSHQSSKNIDHHHSYSNDDNNDNNIIDNNIHSANNPIGQSVESASSSIDSKQTRDNSISILSDTSKTFLTLTSAAGQMSLGSPKIYPTHQSSCIYDDSFNVISSPIHSTMNVNNNNNNTNPSSHLYESPSHLYSYEYERRFHNHIGDKNGKNLSTLSPSSAAAIHNMYNNTCTISAASHSHLHHHHRQFHPLDGIIRVPLPPNSTNHHQQLPRHPAIIRDSNMSLKMLTNFPASSHLKHRQQMGTSINRAFSFDRPNFS